MSVTAADSWTMESGNCLELLPNLADASVDVTITDPPYDEHTHSAGRSGATRLRVAGRGQRERNPSNRATMNRTRTLGFAALSPEAMQATANQLARVTRRWVLAFCSIEMVSAWRTAGEAAGLEYMRTCVWHKLGSTPQFTGDRPAVAVEAIVCFHHRGKGRKRWNGGGKHGYYAHPIVLDRNGNQIRCHTTQKPLSLMIELVADFTEPGELVLDPYAGSGTTGVAAGRLGRRFHGMEMLDGTIPVVVDGETTYPNYYETACRRLRGEAGRLNPQQTEMFA